MRKIRGVKALVEYLKSINCPIGETTIYKLLRENSIPVVRPAERIIIFDLDEIDAWLSGKSMNRDE